ncbi:hypothetical protein WJX84_001057 [Apatococcus fuscideae]|uniref:Uncharacterized protein n=1 Tax=Apatococcus fuscideae TaxID=2026836 RepID=A0AAW1SYS7_9CHLO
MEARQQDRKRSPPDDPPDPPLKRHRSSESLSLVSVQLRFDPQRVFGANEFEEHCPLGGETIPSAFNQLRQDQNKLTHPEGWNEIMAERDSFVRTHEDLIPIFKDKYALPWWIVDHAKDMQGIAIRHFKTWMEDGCIDASSNRSPMEYISEAVV